MRSLVRELAEFGESRAELRYEYLRSKNCLARCRCIDGGLIVLRILPVVQHFGLLERDAHGEGIADRRATVSGDRS